MNTNRQETEVTTTQTTGFEYASELFKASEPIGKMIAVALNQYEMAGERAVEAAKSLASHALKNAEEIESGYRTSESFTMTRANALAELCRERQLAADKVVDLCHLFEMTTGIAANSFRLLALTK